MVVGHGIGDLLPLAPGGPALRCILIERLARVPVPFSAGAFVMEGVLDGVGLAMLSAFLLVAVTVPSSIRYMLLAALAPLLFLVVILLAAHHFLLRPSSDDRQTKTLRAVQRISRQVALGLTAVFGQGPRAAFSIIGMSIMITAVSGAQIELLLRAFDMSASPQSLVLFVVLNLAAGGVPIKFPGSGTVTAAAALSVSGIHGVGTAGYLLISRAIFSSQTTVLALMLLGWWGLSGYSRSTGLMDAIRRPSSPQEPDVARRVYGGATRARTALSAASQLLRNAGTLGARNMASVRQATAQWLPVFMAALLLRLTALALSGGTFDPDEFVILGLGRAVAHGAVPYRDITYFHPPGMLYLTAALQPLIHLWWPISRVAMLLVDSATAVLVWRVARDLYGHKTAYVAGLLYAVSPLALISATRVGPDPIITALGMLGLVQLLRTRSRSAPILAGFCLGLAVWTKYPALLFLPVYLIAAPRHAWRMLAGFAVTVLTLFAPLLMDARAFYTDTVAWQMSHRGSADLMHRLSSVGAYWLGLNFLAVIGLIRRRNPLWVRVGFCSGAIFLFTAQAYYHYFVPIAPFAAILAAPVVAPIFERSKRLAVAVTLAAGAVWALDVGLGPPAARLFVSASSLSAAQHTAAIIDQKTPARSRILSDELEYSLLANRGVGANYFWNMQTAVSAHTLERQLPNVAAVVQTTGAAAGFPVGFAEYLEDEKVPQIRTRGSIVWLLPTRHLH